MTIDRPERFEVCSGTKGRDFVGAFGEPGRKGGGDGWVEIWMEWIRVDLVASQPSTIQTNRTPRIAPSAEELEVNDANVMDKERETVVLGVMVELRDPGAEEVLTEEQKRKGAGGVWDRAVGWEWYCLKLFKPESVGTLRSS